MGNSISPCFHFQPNQKQWVTLIFSDGTRKTLTGKHFAGQIMFEFPDQMVCHADSFFIGHPIPILAIDGELMHAQTYFILPIDSFQCNVLSASSLAALGSNPKSSPIKFPNSPFEYLKGLNGRVLIKVVPEFIIKLMVRGNDEIISNGTKSFICSTPELQKNYDMLVGNKELNWSPNLDTITEYNVRFSPCKFLGFERIQKEK